MGHYTINKLAKMAGISTRALRYYDQFGLLMPARSSENGYRLYGQNEVDRLQHILFYRELGMSLEDIKITLDAISDSTWNPLEMLKDHLTALQAKRQQLDILIANVEKSILAAKGDIDMEDKEKFEGFAEKMIKENESKYGNEVREKYGDAAVDASNEKLCGMSPEKFAKAQKLEKELFETLAAALVQGDPASELAQKAARLHKDWLCVYWPIYSKEAHVGVVQMYVDDERFTAYYDKIATGCAVFLRDTVIQYCS